MADLIVLDREHASISPSSYERVRECTASVPLAAAAPREAASPYADAGSAAHRLLEICLTEELDTFELGGIGNVRIKGRDVPVDQEMLDNVSFCLDWIRGSDLLEDRELECEVVLPLHFAEQYLDRPVYGHADVIARGFPLVVVDAKFGHNPVSANDPQLGLYVLAAILEETEGNLDKFDRSFSVVLQPNREGEKVDVHEWTFQEVNALRDEVIATCRRVRRKDWTYAHGDWCRWCPALAVCPHLAAVARDSALARVVPTPELIATGEVTAARMDEWLANADVLELWIKQLNAVAEDYLIHGGRLDTRKLVRKRTVRRWTDEAKAMGRLTLENVDPFNTPTVISPAEAERRLPPAKKRIVAELSEKPIGELALAKAADKGEPVVVSETLKRALESSVAAGYLEAGKKRVDDLVKLNMAKGEKR